MVRILRGIVHGRTIELIDSPELTDGAEVQVFVRIANEPSSSKVELPSNDPDAIAPWWTDEDDRILAEIDASRRQPSHREIPE